MPGSQDVGNSPNKHKPSENKKARDLRKRAVALIRLLSRFVRNQAYYPRVFFPKSGDIVCVETSPISRGNKRK